MMKLQIWGGAGEHGRSCYLIAGAGHRILLDSGVKKEGPGEYPLLDPEQIPLLTAVFLSHAHEDHSMALPLLYKYGYNGDIWTTRATAEQLDGYFSNWRHYVESRNAELPYGEQHIRAMTFRYMDEEAQAGRWFEWDPGFAIKNGAQGLSLSKAEADGLPMLRLQWGRTGHLAGSVWLRLELEGRRIFFSGDYSRESLLLAADSPRQDSAAEQDALSIMDNAYGLDEETQQDKLKRLRSTAEEALQDGGHVLLPVPAFGRGQDLLVWACEQFEPFTIIAENNIWSGLQRLLEQPEWLRPEGAERIGRAIKSGEMHKRLVIPKDDEERLRALSTRGPCLILTSDGMMESRQARWYYEQLADSERSRVIITGHASKGTFARDRLEEERQAGRCRVEHFFYKVHQGIGDVRQMLKEVPAGSTVLVHAPKSQTDRVRERLAEEGYKGLFSLGAGAEHIF